VSTRLGIFAGKRGSAIPISPPGALQGQVEAMRQHHGGKMRDWFNASSTCWHIVELELVSELADLVFLECRWTKEEGLIIRDGPNYRLLDRVATNAMASRYLARPSARKHKDYYDQLATGSLELVGEDRIAICSAEPGEIACEPSGLLLPSWMAWGVACPT
jgi:hypothetical protein